MEKNVFYLLLFSSIFIGCSSMSYSKSCTFIRGEMQCDEVKDEAGNVAASNGFVFSGQRGTGMNTAAGAGNTGTGTSQVSQTSTGNIPNPSAFGPPVIVPGFGVPGFGVPGFGVPGFGVPGFGGGFPFGGGAFAGAFAG